MKEIRQALICFMAMVILGIIIAFLLYKIENVQSFEQGNIESVLPKKQTEEVKVSKTIRVLIKTTGFKKAVHDRVEVSASQGVRVICGECVEDYGPDEIVSIELKSSSAKVETKKENDKIKIHSIERGYGTPSYHGSLEVFESEGGMVVVNEVELEEYLCSVVPSEMPASYEKEALKAQAICARSYAFNQMKEMSYPEYGAHVDDSVSFQVYNNSEAQTSTNEAVFETAGEMLWYGDDVAKTYFYSTSSGNSTSIEAWGTKLVDANQYLRGVSVTDIDGKDYEENLAWYKWNAVIPENIMKKLIKKNAEKEIGELKGIEITKKGQGGVVLGIEVKGTKETIVVETENRIRKMLGGEGYKITKQDGSVINSMQMLPSAFFSLEKIGDSYIISGGGYGHGIGMSQNGANELAKSGKDYKQILVFFYPGTKVK